MTAIKRTLTKWGQKLGLTKQKPANNSDATANTEAPANTDEAAELNTTESIGPSLPANAATSESGGDIGTPATTKLAEQEVQATAAPVAQQPPVPIEPVATKKAAVNKPNASAAISRNPGLVCPMCSYKIPVTIEQLLGGHGLQCPSCQLKLGVPRQENRDVLNALGKVQNAIDEGKRVQQNASPNKKPKRRPVAKRPVKPRRA